MTKVSSLANRNLEERSFQGQRSRSNPRNFFIFDPKSTSFPPLNGIIWVLLHHIWYRDIYDQGLFARQYKFRRKVISRSKVKVKFWNFLHFWLKIHIVSSTKVLLFDHISYGKCTYEQGLFTSQQKLSQRSRSSSGIFLNFFTWNQYLTLTFKRPFVTFSCTFLFNGIMFVPNWAVFRL